MKLTTGIIALIALTSSLHVGAASLVESNKTIAKLAVVSSGMAAIVVNNADTISTSNCGVFELVGFDIDTPEMRLIYSTLLAAKTANLPVNIYYDDHDNSTDCTLEQVILINH